MQELPACSLSRYEVLGQAVPHARSRRNRADALSRRHRIVIRARDGHRRTVRSEHIAGRIADLAAGAVVIGAAKGPQTSGIRDLLSPAAFVGRELTRVRLGAHVLRILLTLARRLPSIVFTSDPDDAACHQDDEKGEQAL